MVARDASLMETNEDEGGTLRGDISGRSTDDKVAHSMKGRKEEISPKTGLTVVLVVPMLQ